jgi:hypothetical protein
MSQIERELIDTIFNLVKSLKITSEAFGVSRNKAKITKLLQFPSICKLKSGRGLENVRGSAL